MTSSSVSVIANTLAKLLRDTHGVVLLKLKIIKVLRFDIVECKRDRKHTCKGC